MTDATVPVTVRLSSGVKHFESLPDFLEERLQVEENIRVVRPMMEYTIRYLRTGEE